MESVKPTIDSLRRMNKRQVANQILNSVSVIVTAYMIWKALSVYANCPSPVVVVLSESMSPAFERGDILFLTMRPTPIHVGDICVFKIENREIPIVHRAIRVHEKEGKTQILTKGDNNRVDDRTLYAPGQEWLSREDLIGRVEGYLPFLGMLTIIMTDYPKIKYAGFAGLGILVLITRE